MKIQYVEEDTRKVMFRALAESPPRRDDLVKLPTEHGHKVFRVSVVTWDYTQLDKLEGKPLITVVLV